VAAATTIFSNSFDSQSIGALVTGPGADQFTGTSGASNLSVENTVAGSAPNALSVTLNAGGFAFADKQLSNAYTTYNLTFSLQLGADFTVPISDYLVLAQTAPITSSTQTVPITSSPVGKVDVILPADNRVRLDYTDSARQHHFLWGSFVVPKGGWHAVELRETVGAGSGSLALLVDGTIVASGNNLDLGTQGVTWFAVGERYSPPGSGTAGHLYIDNVTAATT
jgi:flagellar basal body rod protein FlgF